METREAEKIKTDNYEEELRILLSKFNSPESLNAALRHYVNVTSDLVGERQVNMILGLLEYAVTKNILQAKLVCEAVLSCPNLRFENQVFWNASFSLIHRIISLADYKGVRDQLKIMLDKVHTIPSTMHLSSLPSLNRLYNVFEIIFDRDASLLPAYLVLDEIQKKMYPKGRWPHWKFARLLSDFVDSFHSTAQMVSIVGQSKLMPVVGYSSTLGNAWELDPVSAKFELRGQLPYRKELQQQQTELLRYVIEQPYSRDMVCSMLGLSTKTKQRSPILEEQIVELILTAMDRSECESADVAAMSEHASHPTLFLWQHLSSLVIYFVLFHYATFPHMVMNLHAKLLTKNYRYGREHLMWVLLQFISGAIQKNALNDFLPIMKLYDILYPETEAIPVPDITKPGCTHTLSAASIWIHLMKKAESESERSKLNRPLPVALTLHYDFLQETMSSNEPFSRDDYRISLICNAYSTNQDCFSRPMTYLVESVQKSVTGNGISQQPTPLSMDLLDSLTVHAKMSLIHSIVTQIMKMAQSRGTTHPSSALIETYSRLLVYTEIESLGIKGFMSQLLIQVFKCNSWAILHTLLEMFTYRLHHVPAHYRVQLLGSLHNISTAPQTNQVQLHLCMESTALKLILGLSSTEVLAIPQFSRVSDPKALISGESEELNKVLVLTLARAIHVTGAESLSAAGIWCTELLSSIMQSTPLQWSSFTLSCFPPVMTEFFRASQSTPDNKDNLRKLVEEEYKKWKAMNNDNDKINHFSSSQAPNLFLCLLWKMVLESEDRNNAIPPVAYIILERIGARSLSNHLRYFADFLVNVFAQSVGGQHKIYVDALNDLIWKCNVVTLDRLILCMCLRAFEGVNSQVCLLICWLLLEKDEFKSRVEAFVRDNSPEHWKKADWSTRHAAFNDKFPEKLFFEYLEIPSGHKYLPVYYSNICLRFLPVIDVIIQRFIEAPKLPINFETLLDGVGCLYKFHEKPITYLYNTLHFYEQNLKDRPFVKKRLVASIISAFDKVKPPNWALTKQYTAYMDGSDEKWIPTLDYYIHLLSRLVDTLSGQNAFPHTDWRFSEFPNPPAHALHCICIELMALPVSAQVGANHLLDVCLVGHKIIPRSNIESWMNAIGLVLTALPDSYWSVLLDRIIDMMTNSPLAEKGALENAFDVMDFKGSHSSMSDVQIGYMIALTHAVWHHASVGQVNLLPAFLKERVRPKMQTEEQFIFVCHLVCPFLQRFYIERTRIVMDVTVELYELLGIIDRSCERLCYMDAICDLLYHIKYMFTGDSVKNEIESIIRHLRPQLQLRLRFITHLTIDEVLSSKIESDSETKVEPMYTN